MRSRRAIGDRRRGPSVAAMSAGNRKIPPPIVTLTMLAARPKVPMDLTREASDEEVGAVKSTDTNTNSKLT